MKDPIGLDVESPRFFWAIDNEGIRGDTQTAYEIIVYNTENGDIISQTNKIKTEESSHIVINNFTILTHGHYKWTIQIWNKSDIASSIMSGYIDSGLLSPNESDWINSSWLYIPTNENPNIKNGLIMNQFRTEFIINSTSPIYKAWCYIVSPNYYKAYINNIQTDNHILGSYTQFEMRVYYDMFNCKSMLQIENINIFGIILGNGWYSQPTQSKNSINIGPPIVKIMIHIQFENGNRFEINSNKYNWYQYYGPIRFNDIYSGEWYDATFETNNWLLPYYNYSHWKKANIILNPIIGKLKSNAIMPKIKKVESFSAVNILNPSLGIYVFDFGQNIAGICEIKIPGNSLRGYNITLIHSEEINSTGYVVSLYEKSPMIGIYTLKGDGNDEYYTPYFVYYGFQYVQIQGYPLDIGAIIPNKETLISHAIHTAFDYIGSISFGPSNDNNNNNNSNALLLNNIESMTRYTSLSNYMNLPTACSQRERHGWLGDAQITMETLIYHWDIAASYTKWIWDISDTQIFINGTNNTYNALPETAPYYNGWGKFPGDPSWTNAYIFFIYKMYKYFGDIRLIKQHYNGMKSQLIFLDSQIINNENGLLLPLNVSQHGDWCSVIPNITTKRSNCQHISAMINTYQYAKQCQYFSELANIIGNINDFQLYQMKFNNAKKGIYNYFWDDNKGYFYDNNNFVAFSTLQSLGLDLGVLINKTDIKRCINAMIYDISITNNGYLVEGIIGIKYILKQLCENKQCLIALNSSLQKQYISYGNWYYNGATTLWEHWQETKYNNDKGSKNHIMFGSQSAFYFQYLAGIKQTNNSINWKQIIIDPFINCTVFDIYIIQSQIDTLRGIISISLQIMDKINIINNIILWEIININIPTTSNGFVYFRRLYEFTKYININKWIIKENNITIWQNMKFINNSDDGIINATIIDQDTLCFKIDSGQYSFKFYTQYE